jgi:thioredoxin-related protein
MKTYIFLFSVLFMTACADSNSDSASTEQTQERTHPVAVKQQAQATAGQSHSNTGGLEWYSIEEAVALNEKNPKMFLIDVYTDWCGWCKVMDKKTFTDPQVQEYIREHFYAVKFNAEQRTPITFNGKEYKFVAGGRRGHNELAAHLLNGRLGYPSFAYLNSDYSHMHVSAGFKPAEKFLSEMKNVVSSKG